MEDLEIKFFENSLDEKNHYSNIYSNMRYRGWYKFEVDNKYTKDIACIFRLPPAVPLYDNVLRQFSDEERKAGLCRMLIGKDLRQEVAELLSKHNDNLNECLVDLSEGKVQDLLQRLERVITFDCNKIPYLHIRLDKQTPSNINMKEEIHKHITGLPDYIKIFYQVLNEEVSAEEADILTNKIVFNEYMDIAGSNKKEL